MTLPFYMLFFPQQSRVIFQQEGERSFHSYYQVSVSVSVCVNRAYVQYIVCMQIFNLLLTSKPDSMQNF